MEKKVLKYAKDFEYLAQRLREVLRLLNSHKGKILNIIGLNYGHEGLNYAIQISFEQDLDQQNFVAEASAQIEGFLIADATKKNPLILIEVFLEKE